MEMDRDKLSVRELRSPTHSFSKESNNSRFSWNPYSSGGTNVQQWLRDSDRPPLLSPALSDAATAERRPLRPVSLSDSFLSGSNSETSTPRRRAYSGDGHEVPVPPPPVAHDAIPSAGLTADAEAMEAVARLRKVKRDESVPTQFRRYNHGMQRRIAQAVAQDESLILDMCERDRGKILVCIVELCYPRGTGSAQPGSASPLAARSTTAPSPSPSPTSKDELTRLGELVLSTVTQNCWRLCTHQGGCVAMTRLCEVMPERQRMLVEDFIVDNFLALAVHPYGNYVVQSVLQKQTDDSVLRAVLIHVSVPSSVIALASNKFGSHVLESFFQVAPVRWCCAALEKLLNEPDTVKFLVSDKFGNYVVQQAMRRLTVAVANPQPEETVTRDGVQIPGSPSFVDPAPAVDVSAKREEFVRLLTPHLRDSPFATNICKALSPKSSMGTPSGTKGSRASA